MFGLVSGLISRDGAPQVFSSTGHLEAGDVSPMAGSPKLTARSVKLISGRVDP